MKECIRCGNILPLTDYYKHKQMADGHLNKCKTCTKSDSKKREQFIKSTPEGLALERKRHRDKYYRLNYKNKHKLSSESKLKIMQAYISKYPEKYKAKNASQRIIKKIKSNHNHHWSYNEEHWKDVIELDVKTHSLIHRYIVYDQERMMYRTTIDNTLLDSRELHLKYCEEMKIKNQQQ